MVFDFDTLTYQQNIDSVCWDRFDPKKVLPLWVADMDFTSPPCVIEALSHRVQQGLYGYTHSPHHLHAMIAGYLREQYAWDVDTDWIVILPSVVSGLYTTVQQLTQPDENVLIPNPVYQHLRLACSQVNRQFTEIPLELKDQRWVLPSDPLSALVNNKTKLALLCNPQNPGSTVFTHTELKEFGELCVQHDLWMCSDEIHAGLVLAEDKRHIPLASISQEISKKTLTLMSLNKTFNFPGTGLAWAVAENQALRKAIQIGLHQTIAAPSLFAYTATVAAIQDGEPWRQALIAYLRTNRDLIHRKINALEGLSVGNMEGSYLAWIDCTKLNHPNPYQLFLDAGLATSPGSQFGKDQFVRLNFATQQTRVTEALRMIETACAEL